MKSGGVWEAPGDALAASWSQDGAQDRQDEPQETTRRPTWRQNGPTWLQDGVPNLLKDHKKSIKKHVVFLIAIFIEFWRDLGAGFEFVFLILGWIWGAKLDPKSKKKTLKLDL